MDKEKVRITEYTRPNTYKVDNPRPDMAYAWLPNEKSDSVQYSAAISTGWEPVKAEEQPDLFSRQMFVDGSGRYAYKEMILMDAPKSLKDSRDSFYSNLADKKEEALKNVMLEDAEQGLDSSVMIKKS